MKKIITLILLIGFTSCVATQSVREPYLNQGHSEFGGYTEIDTPITESLFDDKTATITEENIQKILDGNYSLPNELRVSMVKLGSTLSSHNYYWADEASLKSQQAYFDSFVEIFNKSDRTQTVSGIPDILLSSNPTFTSIRESAVRTQSDIVVIYSIHSDIYSHYKLFTKADIKAFATTQLIILDVRTGLIPFTSIVTKDFQSKKQEGELNNQEAVNRIKDTAVLMTIEEIGLELKAFLDEN